MHTDWLVGPSQAAADNGGAADRSNVPKLAELVAKPQSDDDRSTSLRPLARSILSRSTYRCLMPTPVDVRIFRVTPTIIAVLDYSKGSDTQISLPAKRIAVDPVTKWSDGTAGRRRNVRQTFAYAIACGSATIV